MKINFFDGKNMIIYLNTSFLDKIDLEDSAELEEYFKKLFLRLHKYYHIELSGYYNIIIYHDKLYGAIIKLHKEELDYYNYCDTEIDMRILIDRNNRFLYKVDDILDLDRKLLKSGVIYCYQNHFYFNLKEKLSFIELGYLLEQSQVIYQGTEHIFRCGKKISLN